MQEPRQLDIFSDNGIKTGEPQQLELPLKASAPPLPPGAQLELFSDKKFRTRRQENLLMDVDALQRWKNQILEYQQLACVTRTSEQVALFDLAPSHCDPERIDCYSYKCNQWRFTECLLIIQAKLVYILLLIRRRD